MAWAFIIEPEREPTPLAAQKISWSATLAPVWPIYLIVLVLCIGQLTTTVQGPFLLNSLGVTKASIQGLFGAIPIFGAIVAGTFYGWLHARIPARRIIITVNLLIALGVTGLGAAHGIGQAIALYVLIGLVSGVLVPVSISIVIDRALPCAREVCVGLIISVVGLASFLNPIVARPFMAAFGLRGVFTGFGLLIFIQGTMLIFGSFGRNPPSPKYENRTETLLNERA